MRALLLILLLSSCTDLSLVNDMEATTPTPRPIPPRPTPQPTPAPPVSLSAPYKCTSFRVARDGAKRGFIFLQSRTRGVAKVIFPPDLQARFSRVVLLHKRKGEELHSVVERYRFDAMANPDHGVMRQHWIGTKPTSKLPNDAILYADGLCFKLGAMSERID